MLSDRGAVAEQPAARVDPEAAALNGLRLAHDDGDFAGDAVGDHAR